MSECLRGNATLPRLTGNHLFHVHQDPQKPPADLIEQALNAFASADRSGGINRHARPLPHIFGSAQFLQDSMAGIGPNILHEQAATYASPGGCQKFSASWLSATVTALHCELSGRMPCATQSHT